MKNWRSAWIRPRLVTLLCLSSLWVCGLASAALPKISSIGFEKREVIVSVSVPAGVKKVTLESRARLGSGAWMPRAVSRLEGNGGELTFRLPKSAQAEVLRVRADSEEPLPETFYRGTNEFVAGASSGNPGVNSVLVSGAAAGAGAVTGDAATATRDVVESDIWNISGNTLYFFNQYRGLQVIDLTNPDAPVVTGTFPLPAAGEQMYVVGGKYVLLLAHVGCNWGGTGDESQVLVLDTTGGVPQQVASMPVPGWIQESRLVGSALYVASQAYQPVAGSKETTWEWGSTVSSFDFSTPAKPAVKDTLWFSGYGNVINATDQYLFVVTQSPANWWQSILQCIDVSAPDGTMKALASIATAGRIPDKFKINQTGDVLSVISENWNSGGRGVFTVLETFSLANPTAPEKLGRLQLAQGEQLHASRFDGTRVYIVTFFRMDPLWIVDLSDPKTPHIAGELHVPGWSTYIQPLGDRLVTIGVNDTNDWRVAVSLFDVRDVTKPALLSKVPLGVNNSWSEANSDEKAFAVLPEAGLIMVPYQGYETNGYSSRVQLIDLGPDSLKARGTIDHTIQPRRATLHNDRVYSISGKELLAVDATDRDHPVVRADLELSWNVDRVFVAGDYLLELANGNSWYGWWSVGTATPPSIRVSKTSDPDRPLNTFLLASGWPVVGATLREGKLYLAQAGTADQPVSADPNASAPAKPPTLIVSVFDLSLLPQIKLAGQTDVATDNLGWNPSLQAVWPKPGVLVWSGGSSGWGPLMDTGIVSGGGAVGMGGGVLFRPWRGGNGGRLIAFDVTNPTAPSLASELNLTTNAWWNLSSPFTANGLIYISHQSSEFVEGIVLPGEPAPVPVVTQDKTSGLLVTNLPPVGVWVQRYYLDVVDYADPTSPTARPPVNIPGQLNGVSHGGDLLYTVAPHWKDWVTDWADWLDASAYDGVSASLVTSLRLPSDWPHPLLVNDATVYLGRPDSAAGTSQVESWIVDNSGKFTQTGVYKLGSVANSFTRFGNLLAVQQNNSTVLFDASNPSALVPVGKGQPQGCLGSDLSRGDANLATGLWAPLGDYGLLHINLAR